MLELMKVGKRYKNINAVDDLSFTLEKGEILGLMGPNGAGKSTTLSMIATLIKPDSGAIYYDGMNTIKQPKEMRSILGYVPQEIALYPSLSGLDNLKFWGRAYHIRGKHLKERIIHISKIINISEDDLCKKVQTYSGGMKRKLNIGIALLHKPKLIVLDEPTVGLDIETRDQILECIKELKSQGMSILYAGHYLEEMEQICDTICMMEKGKNIFLAKKEDILLKTGSLEQLYKKLMNTHK